MWGVMRVATDLHTIYIISYLQHIILRPQYSEVRRGVGLLAPRLAPCWRTACLCHRVKAFNAASSILR
jgi:hypothetical protein